ncbi:MAG TPA: vWA domain-containing protein [Vicinamibacteria bacterium]|jgi:hypothetical protein
MTLLALTLAVTAVSSAPARVALAPPRVEVAFVLDTTGSMGGLIEGAKRRIWSIARRIGEGRPRPDLRIALVGYRDLGDEYVTRVHDLSGDVDEVYQNLSAFHADGGGDTPEHVSRALHDAVHRISWSRGAGLRVIFLVGDAPPHGDYQDGFDYRRHVAEARQRGIVVETILCGGDVQAAAVWQQIAALGQGHYAQIDGQGGMPVAVTPVDADLARLNGELAATVVAGGTAAEQAGITRKLEARKAMPAAAAAEAASYFADAGRLAEKDLVDLPAAEQKKQVEELQRAGAAPPAVKGKTADEAVAFLQAQKGRRAELQGRIQTLQTQRERYLRAQPGARADAFDEKVVQNLREQAAQQGIKY